MTNDMNSGYLSGRSPLREWTVPVQAETGPE